MNLFSIDVDAEIRKLCGRQFASPADRVIEWVRLLMGNGAASVRLSLSRRRVCLEGKGLAPTAPGWWQALGSLGQPELPAAARHQALVNLETGGGAGALGLAPAPGLTVEAWGERRVGASGRWRIAPSTLEPGRCQIDLDEGLGARGAQILRRSLRWSTVPVWLDGSQIAQGRVLPHTLLATSLMENGLSGSVGLPRVGELCRSVYLAREVVAQDMTGLSPSGEAHFAVIQDDHADRPEHVRAHDIGAAVRALRAQLYARLPEQLPVMSADEQAVARRLLLKRAEHTGSIDPLAAVPLFPRLEGPPVSPQQLASLAPQGNLWAVDPRDTMGDTSQRWSVLPHRVLVLGELERRFVVERLGWRVSEPPRAVQRGWAHRARQRARAAASEWAQEAQRRWRSFGVQGPIARAELSEPELTFMQALQRELREGRYLIAGQGWEACRALGVEMVSRGALPPAVVTSAAGTYLALPRTHPVVQRAVTAHHVNPGLLYPALALLFAGSDGYGARKQHWQQAWLSAYQEAELPGRS